MTNVDAEMHALLAMRYTVQALDAQLEALMKAKANIDTSQCEHPQEARVEDPGSGMAEVWTCTQCGYVYDERRQEEIDGR